MNEVRTRSERRHDSLAYQEVLIDKLRTGLYPVEETLCFCGVPGGIEIRTHDRYGIPHRLVVCEECALIRAAPRMTAQAYEAFYNNEYRYINHCRTSEDSDATDDEIYGQIGLRKGRELIEWLDDWAIDFPESVLDWGCHVGGMLDAFQEKGAGTWGIEIDRGATEIARSKGHKIVGSIDELIVRGLKVDLVIMQDLIEHLLDLREVQKVGQVLDPGGHIYIWTPGFFRNNPASLFQIAHVYQFCGATLEYVMCALGFAEVYMDEDIKSLWQWNNGTPSIAARKPQEWIEHITDVFFKREDDVRRAPRFRGVCKFAPKLLYSNVQENLALRVPDIYEISGKRSGALVIVGGGPSVDDEIETIRQLHNQGIPVMVIARMYPWCAKTGVMPDYVVSLDCSEEQEKSFDDIYCPDVTYLLASVTRPSILKKLQGEQCYIFDPRENDKMRRFRAQNGYTVATVINAGGSVVVTTISLGMNLGYDDFHIFGLDLLVKDRSQSHSKNIAGQSVQQDFVEIEIDGESILTTPSFVEFANQTLDLCAAGHEDGLLKSIKFYGDSLMNRLWDCTWRDEVA